MFNIEMVYKCPDQKCGNEFLETEVNTLRAHYRCSHKFSLSDTQARTCKINKIKDVCADTADVVNVTINDVKDSNDDTFQEHEKLVDDDDDDIIVVSDVDGDGNNAESCYLKYKNDTVKVQQAEKQQDERENSEESATITTTNKTDKGNCKDDERQTSKEINLQKACHDANTYNRKVENEVMWQSADSDFCKVLTDFDDNTVVEDIASLDVAALADEVIVEAVADPGFPAGGAWTPEAATFRKFVCQNERIGSLRGVGCAPGAPS